MYAVVFLQLLIIHHQTKIQKGCHKLITIDPKFYGHVFTPLTPGMNLESFPETQWQN